MDLKIVIDGIHVLEFEPTAPTTFVRGKLCPCYGISSM
jgi:hypothetical protein